MCGKAGALEVDHVEPLDRGGAPLDPDNLQAICRDCHIDKTNREMGHVPPQDVLDWQYFLRESG